MINFQIREMLPEDAEKLLAYVKRIGGESDKGVRTFSDNV